MPGKLTAATNLLLAILFGALPCTATVAAGHGAPTDDRYDPSKQDPRTDPNSPQFDKNYNPATDPDHPLKNPGKDPGAGWTKHRRSDGTPQVATGKADWDWGELYYDGTYPTWLVITNNCDTPQPVTLFVNNLPYLTIARNHTIPARSQKTISAIIKTPPEPPPPLRLGLPGEPGWGWVEPPPLPNISAAQPFPPPPLQKFHQPNFVDIKGGEVVAWHPWSPGKCEPKRSVYKVSGHIHFRPPKPDSGPQRIATPDVCEVYWNLGEPPPNLGDTDCTEKMRKLAYRYVEKIIEPYRRNAPEAWAWIQNLGPLQEMSIPGMLTMKARGDALMGGKP